MFDDNNKAPAYPNVVTGLNQSCFCLDLFLICDELAKTLEQQDPFTTDFMTV
jgi:hypothetical protein